MRRTERTFLQSVQESGDVTRLRGRHTENWHDGARIDRPRIHDPGYKVIRRVGDAPRNVRSLGESVEWRASQAARTKHTGNLVTGTAAVIVDQPSTAFRTTAQDPCGWIGGWFAAATQHRREHEQD